MGPPVIRTTPACPFISTLPPSVRPVNRSEGKYRDGSWIARKNAIVDRKGEAVATKRTASGKIHDGAVNWIKTVNRAVCRRRHNRIGKRISARIK
jgi:hypothetical protein